MRIIEIKSQNVKIQYKPSEDKLVVGDFVDFNEGAIGLVAQVYRIFSDDNSGEYNQAELTFLITLKYGKAFAWDGEIVSANANVKKTSLEFIQNYINQGDFNDIFALGYCTGAYNQPLRLNFKNFKTPAFVGYEKQSDNIEFMKTIAHQLKFCARKLLIIDFNGNIEIEGAKKITAGFEMKLPLNSEMLENLSSKMTMGVSADAKAVIDEVLSDLAGFARETTDFISISKLINVIDETYKKSKISQLILFKNKLRTYQKQNIFADKISETTAVYDAIATNNVIVLDISNVPLDWRNEFLAGAILSPENALKDYYIYLPIEQDIDNKLLNYLLFKAVKDGIKPILAANYRYVAMDTILDFSANSFLFSTVNALNKREYLSDILQSLPQDYFVVMGELTSSLAITSYLGEPIETLDTQIIQAQNKESNEALDIIQDSIDIKALEEDKGIPEPNTSVDMEAINTALDTKEDDVADIKPEIVQGDADIAEKTPKEEQKITDESFAVQETQVESMPEIRLLPGDSFEETIPSEEEPALQIEDDDIFNEDDKLVHKDILDSNYDTIENESSAEVEDIELDDLDFLDDVAPEQQPYTQSDEDELLDLLSDTDEAQNVENMSVDDLDFEESNLPQQEPEPQQQQKLPVYEADYQREQEKTNTVSLQEGDLVKHNKYGLGTVKKLINHGNKVMCFINFEDFGRRLLDPEISQLEKIR